MGNCSLDQRSSSWLNHGAEKKVCFLLKFLAAESEGVVRILTRPAPQLITAFVNAELSEGFWPNHCNYPKKRLCGPESLQHFDLNNLTLEKVKNRVEIRARR